MKFEYEVMDEKEVSNGPRRKEMVVNRETFFNANYGLEENKKAMEIG
ncbi:MAG: hypothetical protein PV340_03660 [Wolbachia sp.]|nr:hypothetical protein [Wolbachia sp.]MDD9336471.1 hypothetical protein [Wolbachia sp.]